MATPFAGCVRGGVRWLGAGLVALGFALAACDEAPQERGEPVGRVAQASGSYKRPWHEGTFRFLPAYGNITSDVLEADLVPGFFHFRTTQYWDASAAAWVDSYDPEQHAYLPLSGAREGAFDAFVDAMFVAIDRGNQLGGDYGDWAEVRRLASLAGYALARYRDTATGRWFVFGRDVTVADPSWVGTGQAYFVINPEARRDIVVEVPHAGLERSTDLEGAEMFKALAARALIVNGQDRCSGPYAPGSGTCAADTTACKIYWPDEKDPTTVVADVAHSVSNAFYRLHRKFSDRGPTKFIQLHGMKDTTFPPKLIVSNGEVGGGANVGTQPRASTRFATRLEVNFGEPPGSGAVKSCQRDDWSSFCATTNVEGRYTAGGTGASCPSSPSSASERFLHVEQDETGVRDTAANWAKVITSLRETWPECDLTSTPASTSCSLGPSQATAWALPDRTPGKDELTYYVVAEQPQPDALKAGESWQPLRRCSDLGTIVNASPAFAADATMQGTARYKDGGVWRVINLGWRPDGAECWDALGPEYPWGRGSGATPAPALVPFRSIAVDTSRYTIGKRYYVPELAGKTMPALEGQPAFPHDGCVRAVDTGPAIIGAHIDFFVGTRAALGNLQADQLRDVSEVSVVDDPVKCP